MKLLLPLITPKARTVLNRLSFADLDDYEIVKQHLLKEFKLTPREYRSKFIDAKKTAEETYTMFTARLKNLLNYYVKSRKVDKNFEIIKRSRRLFRAQCRLHQQLHFQQLRFGYRDQKYGLVLLLLSVANFSLTILLFILSRSVS